MNIRTLHESDRVGKAIDNAVKDRFGSQRDAAKAIGIANSTLSRYKRLGKGSKDPRARRRIPSLKVLAKLRKELGMKAYKAVLSAINMEINPPKRRKK